MIYLQTIYSRRDPISVGLQNAFLPAFDLTDAMAQALRRLDANERHARAALPVPAPRSRVAALAATA